VRLAGTTALPSPKRERSERRTKRLVVGTAALSVLQVKEGDEFSLGISENIYL
jgi:hypothetical protein